jgi:hypothetical protein
MKLAKSLLLGSAAGLTAVAGAQAADLPVRKAVAVEYVRVCTAYGAGFFYIPGTDTCIRIQGLASFNYQYTSTRAYANSLANGDVSGYSARGRLSVDARTDSAYGTVRSFIRFDIWNQTGGYVNSGTAERFGQAIRATGVDTAGRAQTYVNVDKAFLQFAGFTAGRATSMYDFYSHDFEYIGVTPASDVGNTNLLAYTATFGGGWSATISMEDPTFRRQPVFTPFGSAGGATASSIGSGLAGFTGSNAAFGAGAGSLNGVFNSAFLGFAQVTPVPTGFNAAGIPVAYQLIDIAQRNRVPDVVANVRLDQPWGSAQLSGAIHEIAIGKYQGGLFSSGFVAAGLAVPGYPGAVTGAANLPIALPGGQVPVNSQPSVEYGYAVQGGLKLNLPMITAGDQLYLQAAYSKGALSYTGVQRFNGSEGIANPISGRFLINVNDAFVGANGQLELTEAYSAVASFLHNWTPTVRQAFFAGVAGIDYGSGARTLFGPITSSPGNPGVGTTTAAFPFVSTLKDVRIFSFGTNVTWSPIRDLDIGVEALYYNARLSGRTNDLNKGLGAFTAGPTGIVAPAGVPVGSAVATVKSDDVFQTRLRIQRAF